MGKPLEDPGLSVRQVCGYVGGSRTMGSAESVAHASDQQERRRGHGAHLRRAELPSRERRRLCGEEVAAAHQGIDQPPPVALLHSPVRLRSAAGRAPGAPANQPAPDACMRAARPRQPRPSARPRAPGARRTPPRRRHSARPAQAGQRRRRDPRGPRSRPGGSRSGGTRAATRRPGSASPPTASRAGTPPARPRRRRHRRSTRRSAQASSPSLSFPFSGLPDEGAHFREEPFRLLELDQLPGVLEHRQRGPRDRAHELL